MLEKDTFIQNYNISAIVERIFPKAHCKVVESKSLDDCDFSITIEVDAAVYPPVLTQLAFEWLNEHIILPLRNENPAINCHIELLHAHYVTMK